MCKLESLSLVESCQSTSTNPHHFPEGFFQIGGRPLVWPNYPFDGPIWNFGLLSVANLRVFGVGTLNEKCFDCAASRARNTLFSSVGGDEKHHRCSFSSVKQDIIVMI